MVAPAVNSSSPAQGLSVEILRVGALFSVSAGLAGLSGTSRQDPPAVLLFLGWPVFAVVGAVLLDRQPGSRVGWTLALLSLAPVPVVLWSLARFHPRLSAADLARGTGELAALLAVGVTIAIPWAFRPPTRSRAAAPMVALAGAGGLLVLAGKAGTFPAAVTATGWVACVLGVGRVWILVLEAAEREVRTVRRRVVCLLVTLATACGAVAVGWAISRGDLGYYATCAALVIGSIGVARLWLSTEFRPLSEHLLDVGVVVAVIGTAAAVGLLVELGSALVHWPSTTATSVFSALLTATLAVPAAWWVRRGVLARRYGSGVLPPEDVARITADLHAQTEPRDLLDKAARMVAAASGSPDARILLGDELPVAGERWLLHPLLVGNDRVGALLVESRHPDGPEPRQQRVIAQLLPTVALVARAVGLAVEAEHARRDVSRERDEERRRVLGDLHDGLGPALAGMSMRVQATLRTTGSSEYAELLRDLADGLATSRADLRRIVAGITPPTLADGDLEQALAGLVDSFARGGTGTRVTLEVALDGPVTREVQVAVYRSVAEGITNALRHAQASAIGVRVRAESGCVVVEVGDDGVGGPVVPGVGLSSLARRAESLGGRLTVRAGACAGAVVRVELPAGATR